MLPDSHTRSHYVTTARTDGQKPTAADFTDVANVANFSGSVALRSASDHEKHMDRRIRTLGQFGNSTRLVKMSMMSALKLFETLIYSYVYIYIYITFFNYQSINHASSHNKSHVDIKAYISKRMKILIHAQLADFGRRLLKLHQRHCTISQSVAADRQAALSAPDEAASPQESRSGNGRQAGNRPAPDSLDIAGVARHACIRNSKQHRRTK